MSIRGQYNHHEHVIIILPSKQYFYVENAAHHTLRVIQVDTFGLLIKIERLKNLRKI